MAFEYEYFWLPVNAMSNTCFNWLSDAVVAWRYVTIYTDCGYLRWAISATLAFPVLAYFAFFCTSHVAHLSLRSELFTPGLPER
ncbi:hypothetical protein IW261DRAFT_1567431 [Armillaria novae-zelandiae]|uniref:Uncharacterized protein n=1 Tax=Armillaria novae-zelandiae TaxID=153914 RepID=A0AA39UBE0_9AGAR|nr:hypothetical protein IW261DRAFT_1567431 [Armillaria novae-zelandiae]